MRNTVGTLRGYKNRKEEVKEMKDITILISDVEVEIADGIKTVTLWHEGYELIGTKDEVRFLDTEEAIEDLVEKAAKWLNLNITILTDVELILTQAYKVDNKIQLRFRDEDTGKIHELNFNDVGSISLNNFIERNKSRMLNIFREALEVDVVKIAF